MTTEILEAMRELDGTTSAAVRLLTGLTDEQLTALGGIK